LTEDVDDLLEDEDNDEWPEDDHQELFKNL